VNRCGFIGDDEWLEGSRREPANLDGTSDEATPNRAHPPPVNHGSIHGIEDLTGFV
jgi:hypothetical protein